MGATSLQWVHRYSGDVQRRVLYQRLPKQSTVATLGKNFFVVLQRFIKLIPLAWCICRLNNHEYSPQITSEYSWYAYVHVGVCALIS